MSSSRSHGFESCGELKSQNSSLQLGAQGDEYSGRLNIDFGFKPEYVIEAAKLLEDPQEVEEVIASGFSTFLNLTVETICERKETNLCMKIVDLEENRIKVQLQKGVIVYITPEEIEHLLKLPRGDKAPLKYNKQQHRDFKKLRIELGDPDMKLEVAEILDLMGREDKKHLKFKCFCLILISKFLLPSTQQKTINVHAVMYTQDMTSIKDYDWCAIVYEELRECIRTWKNKTRNKADKSSATMPGCVIIILAYIVDNLKLMEIEDKKCPRINQYTMDTLMSTIGRAKCRDGRISFDNFKLKPLEETCYAESSRLYIHSPVESQHSVSAVVTSGVPPRTQMPMPTQLLDQVHSLLSQVQPGSCGIDPEALQKCISGLAFPPHRSAITFCTHNLS